MVVHMVRLWSEDPDDYSEDQIEQAVQDWVDSYEEVLTTQRLSYTLYDASEDELRDVTHWRGDWRFSWDEDRQTLLDDLESDLQPYVEWYRIKYHECTHDGTGGACSWDEEREYGNVPEDL